MALTVDVEGEMGDAVRGEVVGVGGVRAGHRGIGHEGEDDALRNQSRVQVVMHH